VSGRNSRGVRKESGCQGETGRGSLGVRGCEEEMSGSPQEEAEALQGGQPRRQESEERRQGSCGKLQGSFRADQSPSGKEGGRQGICRRLQGDLRAVQGRQEVEGRGRSPLKGEVLEVGYGMVVDVVDRDEMLKGCIKPG